MRNDGVADLFDSYAADTERLANVTCDGFSVIPL